MCFRDKNINGTPEMQRAANAGTALEDTNKAIDIVKKQGIASNTNVTEAANLKLSRARLRRGTGSTNLTGAMGALDQNTIGPKTLLGQ